MRVFHISEPRDVDPVRPAAGRATIGVPRIAPRRSRAVMVIHQVAPERAARVCEAVGESRRLRIEQNTRRLDRGGAEKYYTSLEHRFLHGVGVDHAHAARASFFRIVDHLCDDAVRTQRQLSRFFGRGQRRADAVEIRVRDAAALARTAVVARGAAVVILGEDRRTADRHHALAAELTRGSSRSLPFRRSSSASAQGTRRRAAATILRARP